MRWFPVLVLAVAVVLSGAGAAPASVVQPVAEGQVAPPSALVLVERLTTDEALAAAGSGTVVGGFVSTLPVDQPLASRVLSLAAGRRVDAKDALEGDPAAGSGLPGPATVERIRADHPGARFGRLPPTRVLAAPGLEVAGLFALGPSGPAPPADPLRPGGERIPLRPGRLLVLAVPDASALAALAPRLEPTEGAGPVMVLGLRGAPGRGNAAPLLVLGQPGAGGLVTSDSTRHLGLVALEDVRPTVAAGTSAGDDGSLMRLVDDADPTAAITRIDRRAAALVLARTWAIPLLCLAGVLAVFSLLAVWRGRSSGGPRPPGAAAFRRPGPPGPPTGEGSRRPGPPGPSPAEGSRRPGVSALGAPIAAASRRARPVAAARLSAEGAWLPGSRTAGPEPIARSLIALTLALPPGYLVASMAEPAAARTLQALAPAAFQAPGAVIPWAATWVAAGIAVATALATLALRLDRPAPDPAPAQTSVPVPGCAPDPAPDPAPKPAPDRVPGMPGAVGRRAGPRWGSVADWPRGFPRLSTAQVLAWTPTRVPAPVLLGAVLLGLVTLDLVLGGEGLAQPLLGGSAWDGERFYGLGNGYFAFSLAAAMLVIGFTPLPAVPAAALLAGLGVVDGLPRLGADVGGALTSMLTAGAALVLLAPRRPRLWRALLVAGLAVAAAGAVALGVGLGGPVTHAGRFAERLQQGPADAAWVVADQLTRNLRLLANNPFAWVGPLQVVAAGLIALRRPPPLQDLPGWARRVLGLGAFGSLLLLLLNDTGVTATAASGMFLLAIPAWAWLDGHRPAGPPPAQPPARPAVGVRPPGS